MARLGVLVVLGACVALGGCPSRAGGGAIQPAQTYVQSSGWTPPPAENPGYQAVARASTATPLTPDGALATVAAELARRVARDPQARTPSVRVIQAVAWLAGVTDPMPVVLTVKGAPAQVDAEVERGVREILQSEPVTHVGIGRAHAGGADVVVVAATRRRVQLDAVPRSVAAGARVSLRGRVVAGLRTPMMTVTHPDGHTEESPLGEGPDFLGQFPVSERGTWQVEVSADSDEGSTVLANFPVYVDTDPPATPEETATVEAEEPSAVEAALLRSINEARERAHLAPVEVMPALAEAARAHSRDMAENHYVAHNSQAGATPGQRLRDAGLLSGLSLENVARGYSAREIHEGLMVSPGHRANVLNPRVTHVGVGVVREAGSTGALLVTQDFIEVARAIDASAAAAELLTVINRGRAARGAPALTVRPQLQAAAESAARAYFADPRITQDDALGRATSALRSESLLFRRIQLVAAFGPRYQEAVSMQPLFERDSTAVGVGVAQGDRPGAPPRSVFVVYVLAVPR